MFHSKPWHLAAFFVLMPIAVLIATNLGLGANGLFVSILAVAALVAVGGIMLKRLKAAFRSRSEAFAFLVTGNVEVTYPLEGETQIDEEDTAYGDGPPEAPYVLPLAAPAPIASAPRRLPEQLAIHSLSDPRAYEDRLNLAPDLRPHADEVLSGRISIFGVSGSGKSNTLAVLCEEMARLGVPLLLADTEDEYSALCHPDFFPRGYLAGSVDALKRADIPRYLAVDEQGAATFGRVVIEQGLQVILNLNSYATDEEAAQVMVGIIKGMRVWEEERMADDRVSCMFILEEASVWLPQNARESLLSRECLAALQQALFATIVRRGRKRGIGFTFATQRIAEIDKRAMSSSWTILHRQTQDVDLKRYEEFGIDREQAMNLVDGEAFVFSPTESNARYRFRLRRSPHGARTPGLESVLRHRRALYTVPVQLDTYAFTAAALEQQRNSPAHLTAVAPAQSVEEKQHEPPLISELERAVQAWKSGANSVRKLQTALGDITYYRANELYRQMRQRRLID